MKLNYSFSLINIDEMNGGMYDANCIVTIYAECKDAPFENVQGLTITASVDFLADCDEEGGFSLRADVRGFSAYDDDDKEVCPADFLDSIEDEDIETFLESDGNWNITEAWEWMEDRLQGMAESSKLEAQLDNLQSRNDYLKLK